MMFDPLDPESGMGDSLVHRCSAGIKLGSLFLVSVALFSWPNFWFICLILGGVFGLYLIAGFSWRTPFHHMKPLLLLMGMLFLFSVLSVGGLEAGIIVLRLVCLFLLAGLITLTTPLSIMMACFEHFFVFLKPVGLNPLQAALVFSLTLRFVPLLNRLIGEVRQAQAARGLERSFIAIFIPVIILMLKMSEDIANALEARGYDA